MNRRSAVDEIRRRVDELERLRDAPIALRMLRRYETELAVSGAVGSCLSRILTRRIHLLINLGVLKHHQSAGVTIALKNLSHGLVNNVARSHATRSLEPNHPATVAGNRIMLEAKMGGRKVIPCVWIKNRRNEPTIGDPIRPINAVVTPIIRNGQPHQTSRSRRLRIARTAIASKSTITKNGEKWIAERTICNL